MPAPEVVIPLLEGTVGSLANGKETVSLWMKMCKEIMLATGNKDQTDWDFLGITDIDESGPAGQFEATTSVIYAILVGQKSADAGGDFIVLVDDAGGGYAYDATAAEDNTFRVQHYLPAASVDLVEELHPFVYPAGIPITTDALFCADGTGGTNPDTDDIRMWVLYRTGGSAAI